jgi:hypothetical protein
VPRSSATAILAAYRHGLKLTTASSWPALPARRRLQLRRGEDLLRQERQCADVDGANSLGHPDFRADDHGTSSTIPTSAKPFPSYNGVARALH